MNLRDCFGFKQWCSYFGRMILWMYPSFFVNVCLSCWVLTPIVRVRHLISPRWLEKMYPTDLAGRMLVSTLDSCSCIFMRERD
jgi:hypothetical protein